MFKKCLFVLIVLVLLFTPTGVALADKPTNFDSNGNITNSISDNGFDEWGYNRTARIFSGTGWEWCMGKVGDATWCTAYLGAYANDKIVMKWNAEWDRGNAENWANPPYNAEENNIWNGHVEGGSGETWMYKIVWVGPCGSTGTPVEGGGYCIWGEFAVIMSQGTADGVHMWETLAKPAGYGAYYTNP